MTPHEFILKEHT